MYIRQGNGILKMYKTAVLSDKKLQDTFAQIAHRLYTTNLVLQNSLEPIPVFNAKDYERLFETFFEKMVHGRFEDHCQYGNKNVDRKDLSLMYLVTGKNKRPSLNYLNLKSN